MIIETKSCQNCKQNFDIAPEDFLFYEKIKVPPPTWCWQCRLQRRTAWRNENALYKRICDLCRKPIFALYPSDVPFPVYCNRCWFSDKWDPMQYGRGYDFSKNFFFQFKELQDVVPRIALQIENVVNCDYTNQIADCKNCYLITSGVYDEECMYCHRVNYSKNTLDSFGLVKCQNVYEGTMGRESSDAFFSRGFADSFDPWFCDESRGAKHCFMTANIRRKSYVFRGKELSKEEYQNKFAEINHGSFCIVEKLREEFKMMTEKALHPHGTFKNAINTTGNALANANNCRYCFFGANLENCRYCLYTEEAKDSMDVNTGGYKMELAYDVNTTGLGSFNVKFCNDAWPEVRNLTYCDSCRSGASDLFGCISLRGKQYCILNCQYSKEDYESLVSRIIADINKNPYVDRMGRSYAYGEFFPPELSPIPYHDSMAQDLFPLSAEEVQATGFRWNEKVEKRVEITLPANDIPDDIKDISEDILRATIGCVHAGLCNQRCTVGFRIIPQELQFYKKYELPIPRLCPNCRQYERAKQRLPINLWHRQCACDYIIFKNTVQHAHHPTGQCTNKFESSYAPDRPEVVYCESCYNSEVA